MSHLRRWLATTVVPRSPGGNELRSSRFVSPVLRSRDEGSADRHRHVLLHRHRGIDGAARPGSAAGEYAALLDEHRRLLRAAFADAGGREVDTQGDAFFVAFASATGAVQAAARAQRETSATPLPIRIGIHTGEPSVGPTGYVGLDVPRAARICSAAHGGQVVISQATRELVEDEPARRGHAARPRRAPAQGSGAAAAALAARDRRAAERVPGAAHAREPADQPARPGDAADRPRARRSRQSSSSCGARTCAC